MADTFDVDSLRETLSALKSDPSIANNMLNHEVVTGEVTSDARTLETIADAVLPSVAKRTIPQFPKKGLTIKYVNKILPWVENYWLQYKRYPSTDAFIEEFGFERDEVLSLNSAVLWLKCLDRRGIKRPNIAEDFLSPTQQAAISLLTNFHDRRPKPVKLAAIGVDAEQLNGWMNNPAFKEQLNRRSDEILGHVGVDANIGLANLIQKEDFRAIKFYFEITGQAASPEAINVKQTMQILIEAVQKHVSDPAVLQAIAAEVAQVRSIQGVQ